MREWLSDGESLAMSVIGWTEFLCGPVSLEQVEAVGQLVPQRVAFDEGDAVLAARLFNDSGRRRGSLTDCMIAATAIRNRAPLATTNTDDFRRFSVAGLEIVEP